MTQVIEKIGGEYENRTHVHGFAIRCVTTPPTRPQGRAIRLTEVPQVAHIRKISRSGVAAAIILCNIYYNRN